MIVRDFKRDDEETFLQLCREFYGADATLRAFSETTARKTFNRIMDRHENLWGYLLFDLELGEPVGYSLVTSYWCNEEGGNVLIIDELFISTRYRRKGYACMFMNWLAEKFQNDAVSITLEVLNTNQSAKCFYDKEGFSPDGFMTYTKYLKANA